MSTCVRATPLSIAAWAGKTDSVRALLQAGASTEVRDSRGYTPLMMAAFSDADSVEELMEWGADRDARTAIGETA